MIKIKHDTVFNKMIISTIILNKYLLNLFCFIKFVIPLFN